MTALNIDRIAASSDLWELAECYQLEALKWREPVRRDLKRDARLLAEHARRILHVGDLEIADAYATAGRTLLDQVIARRRLLEQITHEHVPMPSNITSLSQKRKRA